MFCFKCGADISEQDETCPSCGAPIGRNSKSEQLPAQHQSVSFRNRAAAFGIDLLFMLVVWYVLFRFFYWSSFYMLPVLFVLYFTRCFGGHHAASFGQRCLNIRVITAKDGSKPGYLKGFVRALTLMFSVGLAGIGCFISFITGGRMLHDLLSGTCVVCSNEK